MELFIKYNTPFHSSTAVERMFSSARDIVRASGPAFSSQFLRISFHDAWQNRATGIQGEVLLLYTRLKGH